jgi:ligand-binding sensor domain-containing protein
MQHRIITTLLFLSFVWVISCKERGKTGVAQVKPAVTQGNPQRAQATPAVTQGNTGLAQVTPAFTNGKIGLVQVTPAFNKNACSPFLQPLKVHMYGNTYNRQRNQTQQISEYVRRIFEDSRGNLWFGTGSDGICRYDGNTLVYFSTQDGLSGKQVTGIVEDQRGNIWVSTIGGISMYDGKRFTNFTEQDGLPSNAVWSLYEDSRGTIWAGTLNGLCKYTPGKGAKFCPFALPQADVPNAAPLFSAKLVSSILEDKGGNLWFGTDGVGVCKYDPSAQKTGAKQFTHLTKADGLCDNTIVCIIEDREGNLWFSSRLGGLSRYTPSATTGSGKSFTNFTARNSDIGSNEVWTMHEDSAGAIWFGPKGSGVYRFKDNQLSHFGQGEGLPIRAVQSIFEDSKGRLWIGGGNDGLHFYDGKRFIQVNRDGPWRPGC